MKTQKTTNVEKMLEFPTKKAEQLATILITCNELYYNNFFLGDTLDTMLYGFIEIYKFINDMDTDTFDKYFRSMVIDDIDIDWGNIEESINLYKLFLMF